MHHCCPDAAAAAVASGLRVLLMDREDEFRGERGELIEEKKRRRATMIKYM